MQSLEQLGIDGEVLVGLLGDTGVEDGLVDNTGDPVDLGRNAIRRPFALQLAGAERPSEDGLEGVTINVRAAAQSCCPRIVDAATRPAGVDSKPAGP